MPARVKERIGPLSYTDTFWRRHIDQLRSSNVPLESVPVSVPSTPAVPANNGSDTAPSQDGTVIPCKVPQSPILACEERRYPTRVRKPPNCLDL